MTDPMTHKMTHTCHYKKKILIGYHMRRSMQWHTAVRLIDRSKDYCAGAINSTMKQPRLHSLTRYNGPKLLLQLKVLKTNGLALRETKRFYPYTLVPPKGPIYLPMPLSLRALLYLVSVSSFMLLKESSPPFFQEPLADHRQLRHHTNSHPAMLGNLGIAN